MRKLRWIATAGMSPPVAAVTSTTARAAGRTIASAGAIPNRCTGTLKDFSTARPNSPAARFGGRVDRIFSTALNGFSGVLSGSAARRPVVALVERDQVVRFPATQSNPSA
jgi:hypothetical protein